MIGFPGYYNIIDKNHYVPDIILFIIKTSAF